MLLVIDIGNTNITIGIFKNVSGCYVRGPVKTWRLSTDVSKSADEYGKKLLGILNNACIKPSEIKALAIAGVVPCLNKIFKDAGTRYLKCKPFFVEGKNQKIIKIRYSKPKEVGADRIANAAAAFNFFGGPVVVIDFGTATTFDCVSKNHEYLGGAIVPGPALAADSLSRGTALLPGVKIAKPKKVIGKSTISSIQSGLYYGYVGLIKEVLKRISKEIPGNPRVIATGGLADLIVKEVREVEQVVPELTLEGIRIVYGETVNPAC